ncbi:MAG: transglycosylase domain-containing protein [Reinekea sp.]
MKLIFKTLRFIMWSTFATICGLVLISASMYLYLSPALPDVQTLKDFKLQTPMRILSADNKLIAEYGEKRRSPLHYEQIPTHFVQALIAIEDKRFEYHHGVDPVRFTRVVLDLLLTGDKEGAGGSTLTQQVARNYFLSQQKTFTRKFTEILLALKMESELSKQEIFELYINKHFLGYRSYGIQAAATVYYGKDINDLKLPQLALIAGLHQAPSSANPIANPERALAEMIRSDMLERFGDNAYNDGYTVYATINSELQKAANRGVQKTLLSYTRRHGYLGPEAVLEFESENTEEDRKQALNTLNDTAIFGGLIPALVIESDENGLTVIPQGQLEAVLLPIKSDTGVPTIGWARERISINQVGARITTGTQVAPVNSIVRLEKLDNGWSLAQVPAAQGALVALSPSDGSVLSLTGGFDFLLSKYNRVVQSSRQPGSNFKPFIYSGALDKGYTPATIVNDAPLVKSDNSLEDVWRPKNSGDRYLGPIPMRQALYQSRNLSSIRILDDIGVSYARQYVSRFGFNSEELANDMTLILGSTAMAPIQIAQGYATFANGGYAIEPYYISRIEDKDGNIVFEENPAIVCKACPEAPSLFDEGETTVQPAIDITPLALNIDDANNDPVQPAPKAKHYAKQVLSPQTAYLMNSMLRDVIQRGTGRAARAELPRKDLAGKTGTTNDAIDAWFTGFNGDIVASAWVGFDSNTSLGNNEFGGKAALPAWVEFMKTALKDKPENTMPLPVGIVQVRIDPKTGLLARPGTKGAKFEYFNEKNVPTRFTDETLTIDFSADRSTPVDNKSVEPETGAESLF